MYVRVQVLKRRYTSSDRRRTSRSSSRRAKERAVAFEVAYY